MTIVTMWCTPVVDIDVVVVARHDDLGSVTVVMMRSPLIVHVDMIMVARYYDLVMMVVAAAWRTSHMHIDMVIVTRHDHVRVMMVMTMRRWGWRATVKVHMLIITRDLDWGSVVVVADMDVVISARDLDLAMRTARF